jgi:cob(I)alamin adenosyltransferase
MNYNPRMTFYTRKGDDGTTGLLGKGRVPKFHLRIEALGTLDESTATLGLARASVHDPRSAPLMLNVQRDLYRLMAEVAAAPEHADQFRFDEGRVQWIEEQTDLLSKTVEMPNEFIIPGDSIGGASLSLARAVVRRAERRVAELLDAKEITNSSLQQYLNRLSSLLFVLELIENQTAGKHTTLAKK